jgi:hypothetical protein
MENFRLHLSFAMKNKFAKVRSTAGLFLEALMLVFIFAYANGNFEARASTDSEQPPLKSVVLSYSMAISAHSLSLPFDNISKNQVSPIKVLFASIDLHGTCVTLSKSLRVGSSERNTFYIASADNIP